jgi:very-short-patch-repair endonuclease
VTPDEVVRRVEGFPGCAGVRQARHLARLIEPATESFGESWLRLRVVDAGFPQPRVQIEIVDEAGYVVFRLDLGWDDVKVALEYDGEEFHSTPEQIRHDLRRRNELETRFGWRVLAVRKGEVLGSSLALERAIGELLSREPRIFRRRW